MPAYEKVVVVTKKTALDELVERFNTRDQARFYLEHMGASFDGYQLAHDAYQRALARLQAALPGGVRAQFIERSYLPTFSFAEHDLVVTLGPDGLVVNTAKYLAGQPLLAFNPDPQRIDGVLIPFGLEAPAVVLGQAMQGHLTVQHISMARAALNDGQTLHAVNDLFVGQRTHVSARYRLRIGGKTEEQSSSGIIVSTGAGSTGWFRSLLTGASGIASALSKDADVRTVKERYRFDRQANYLYFVVREPFISKVSAGELVFRRINAGEQLEVISQMPQNGVIFSDGVEADYLAFNSGAIAHIGLAEKKVNLIVPVGPAPARPRHASAVAAVRR